jgi:hypothetical protein
MVRRGGWEVQSHTGIGKYEFSGERSQVAFAAQQLPLGPSALWPLSALANSSGHFFSDASGRMNKTQPKRMG